MKNFLKQTTLKYALGFVIGATTIISTMNVSLAQVLTAINSPNKSAISNVVLYIQNSSGQISKIKIDSFSGEVKTYNPGTVLQSYPGSTLVAYTVKAGTNKSNMGPGEGELVILNSSLTQDKLPTGSANTTLEYSAVLKISPTTPTTQTPPTTPTTQTPPTTTTTQTPPTTTTTQTPPTTPTTQTPPTTTTTQTPPTTPTTQTPPTTTTTQTPPTTTTQTTPTETKNETPIVTNIATGTSLTAQAPDVTSVPEPGTVAAVGIFGLGLILKKRKRIKKFND
jgi:hypothetical protein